MGATAGCAGAGAGAAEVRAGDGLDNFELAISFPSVFERLFKNSQSSSVHVSKLVQSFVDHLLRCP